MQKWKSDPKLYDCDRNEYNQKKLNYDFFVSEFMSKDPVRDWESIKECISLWIFLIRKVGNVGNKILDAGTKDGQFTEYLTSLNLDCIGIEIDDVYVEYAQSKNRNVIKDNICDMSFNDNTFDVVFSHHVLGLCPSYTKSYQELLRVVKPGGYVITLNDIEGNPRKHYSLINRPEEVEGILAKCVNHDILYFDWWKNASREFVVLLKKL